MRPSRRTGGRAAKSPAGRVTIGVPAGTEARRATSGGGAPFGERGRTRDSFNCRRTIVCSLPHIPAPLAGDLTARGRPARCRPPGCYATAAEHQGASRPGSRVCECYDVVRRETETTAADCRGAELVRDDGERTAIGVRRAYSVRPALPPRRQSAYGGAFRSCIAVHRVRLTSPCLGGAFARAMCGEQQTPALQEAHDAACPEAY